MLEFVLFDVIYEDDVFVVINKLVGFVVYLVVGNWSGMIFNGFLYCYGDVVVGLLCVGIVYWFDKEIFGLMVVVCMLVVQMDFVCQLQVCMVKCCYFVLVWGMMFEVGMIDVLIGCDLCECMCMVVVIGVLGKFVCMYFCMVDICLW